ncbi:hypothetical protein QN239_07170 [Mycolicibacterium sp. Y3]
MSHTENIANSCPTNGTRVASFAAIDGSLSQRDTITESAEQEVLRRVAERTFICSGHLRVTLFSGSMIGVTVFDGDLQLDGATATARLRKAPDAVDAVMEQINTALPDASNQLTDGNTDIVGQYELGAEYESQLSAAGRFQLEQTILTDGIQTAGQYLGDPALTDQQAEALAATFTVPDLSGAEVRLIGIGRQADRTPLPTSYITALRTFHTAVCKRTHAAQCVVVIDAAGA